MVIFKNKTHDIIVMYETWLGEVEPVLTCKFQPGIVPGEMDEDREIRQETSILRFEAEKTQ